MQAVQFYLISFSCFVENNTKTTARVVTVCEICMSAATIKCGCWNVDVDRLDVVRLALCACVTTATECERTEWMRTYWMLFAVLTSKATADSPERAISGTGHGIETRWVVFLCLGNHLTCFMHCSISSTFAFSLRCDTSAQTLSTTSIMTNYVGDESLEPYDVNVPAAAFN